MPTESAKSIPRGAFSRTRDDAHALAALAKRQHGGTWNQLDHEPEAVATDLRALLRDKDAA